MCNLWKLLTMIWMVICIKCVYLAMMLWNYSDIAQYYPFQWVLPSPGKLVLGFPVWVLLCLPLIDLIRKQEVYEYLFSLKIQRFFRIMKNKMLFTRQHKIYAPFIHVINTVCHFRFTEIYLKKKWEKKWNY